ncbi:MAG TPA: ATP-binding cassette domain-containing protein [Thermoanaerobaculia bacterium]|nr:ATP-binding cassette domain-containing protein [Thermoanaerobaculia bacterium]
MESLPSTPGLGELYHVEGLSKSYGKLQVLDQLSFGVERRECLVIMGRSGCGKSVTLRLLNGLEAPDSGRILLDGTDIVGLTERELYPVRRRVAMLFQSGALFDSMTVLENIAFPLREHTDLGDQAIAAKVAEKLALVRLSGIEQKMPADLSGGMRKRVALARSLALDPEVVLFDEPTSGLDPVTSATIAELILGAREAQGVTSVVVTHDIPLGRRVGDRVAFLEGGEFRFLGTWDEADRSDDPVFCAFLAGSSEAADAA